MTVVLRPGVSKRKMTGKKVKHTTTSRVAQSRVVAGSAAVLKHYRTVGLNKTDLGVPNDRCKDKSLLKATIMASIIIGRHNRWDVCPL